MRRALQQQAQCWLPMLATIDVALEIRLGQRVVPHHAHHDVQVRHGCKHQCLLASSIVACGLVRLCATNAQHEEVGQHVRDEQLQQRSDHRRGRVRQLTASELAQSWRAPRPSAATDIASREVFFFFNYKFLRLKHNQMFQKNEWFGKRNELKCAEREFLLACALFETKS